VKLLWRMLRQVLRPHRKALLVRFLVTAAVAATPYAFSFMGKWLVDDVLQVAGPPKPPEAPPSTRPAGAQAPAPAAAAAAGPISTDQKLALLAVFLAASMGIHVLATGVSGLSEWLNARTVHKMTYDLRTAVHERLSRLEMGLFSREQVGQLMTRTLDDTGMIPGNLTQLVINTATQVAMLVLGLVLLSRLNPQMTLIVLATLPFYAVTCVVFLPRIRTATEQFRQRFTEFSGHIVERLSNILTVKNYAQEDREQAAFGALLDRNRALGTRQNRLNLYFGSLTTLITAAGTLTVLAIGFVNIRDQRMQLGEVLAFYQVTAQLFVPISALVGMASLAQTLCVYGQRVYGLLDVPETLQDAPDAVELSEIRGQVQFDDCSLRYQEGGPFAVRNVSLSVPAGSTACLVGPTGCGKSTLIALLTRLYDPTGGCVRLDGVDIRKLRVTRLRRAIGNILHDCQVFSATLAENLRIGAPDATAEQIEQAARAVGLHEFVQGLADGYQTRLGRGGLSLGPQQLVQLAVARALVTRPAVLTIDDTFSAIEQDAEQRLRAAIRNTLADQTVLIATSRLSICPDADLVVVMQRGGIVQVGSHDDLLAVPGLYRRMYMRYMGIEELDGGAATGGSGSRS
jgi:ABC-type multidrug transport system fused ATPase/permease subunit